MAESQGELQWSRGAAKKRLAGPLGREGAGESPGPIGSPERPWGLQAAHGGSVDAGRGSPGLPLQLSPRSRRPLRGGVAAPTGSELRQAQPPLWPGASRTSSSAPQLEAPGKGPSPLRRRAWRGAGSAGGPGCQRPSAGVRLGVRFNLPQAARFSLWRLFADPPPK